MRILVRANECGYTHFQIFLKEGESAAILQLIVFLPSLQVLCFDLVSLDCFGSVVSLAQPILQLPAFQNLTHHPILYRTSRDANCMRARSNYGKKSSMKLLKPCFPTMMMANWMQSSDKQPAGSHTSPFSLRKEELRAC